MENVEDIRDIVVIAAFIGLTIVGLVATIVGGAIGWRLWRTLRRVRRLHDQRLVPALDRIQQAQERWNARADGKRRSLLAIGLAATRTLQRRRAKRGRLARLRSLFS